MAQSKKEELQGITQREARVAVNVKFPHAQTNTLEYQYHAWCAKYGNTAGPFLKPGMLAGQAFTDFTLECWSTGRFTVVFCKGEIIDVREDINGFEVGRNYGG